MRPRKPHDTPCGPRCMALHAAPWYSGRINPHGRNQLGNDMCWTSLLCSRTETQTWNIITKHHVADVCVDLSCQNHDMDAEQLPGGVATQSINPRNILIGTNNDTTTTNNNNNNDNNNNTNNNIPNYDTCESIFVMLTQYRGCKAHAVSSSGFGARPFEGGVSDPARSLPESYVHKMYAMCYVYYCRCVVNTRHDVHRWQYHA